jgi:hypothetical protein
MHLGSLAKTCLSGMLMLRELRASPAMTTVSSRRAPRGSMNGGGLSKTYTPMLRNMAGRACDTVSQLRSKKHLWETFCKIRLKLLVVSICYRSGSLMQSE